MRLVLKRIKKEISIQKGFDFRDLLAKVKNNQLLNLAYCLNATATNC